MSLLLLVAMTYLRIIYCKITIGEVGNLLKRLRSTFALSIMSSELLVVTNLYLKLQIFSLFLYFQM